MSVYIGSINGSVHLETPSRRYPSKCLYVIAQALVRSRQAFMNNRDLSKFAFVLHFGNCAIDAVFVLDLNK